MIKHLEYAPKMWGTVLHYSRLVWTFRNWPTYFKMKRGRRGDRTFEFRTRGGLSFNAPAKSQQVFKDIFMYDSYSFRALQSALPERPLIIDLGANIGLFSLFVFSMRPSAYCISAEPFPGNFQILAENQKSNPARSWSLLQAAVSGSEGKLELFAPNGVDFTAEASLLAPAQGQAGAFHATYVDCITLATLFSRFSIERCHWLKIDCEGAEYDILYSCPEEILERIDAISMETHHVDDATRNLGSLARFLAGKGYDSIHKADDEVIHARRTKISKG